MHTPAPFLLATALVAASGNLPAAEADTEALDPLSIIVTGTRSEQPIGTAPGQIDVISRRQIDASGAQSVVEVLRASGAVQINQNSTGNSNDGVVSMRGFGENAATNVLILVDGRPLNNPTLEAPNLSIISLNAVERIEVLHGSAGVLYGQHAVGGVINIITREIEGTRGQLSSSYGSYGRKRLTGSFSHRYQSGVGIAIAADSDHNDSYRDNSETEFDQFSGELSYRHDSGEIAYRHEGIDNDQRLPGSLSDAEVAADRRASNKPNDFFDEVLRIDTLRLEQALSSALRVNAQWSQRDSNGEGFFFGDFPQDLRVESFNPQLQGQWQLPSGQLLLTAGADLIDSDYQTSNLFGSTDSEQDSDAYYLRVIYPLARDWTLTAGGRDTQVKDKDKVGAGSSKNSAFVKELGLSWQLAPEQHLFLRRDENVRFAAIEENAFTLPGIDTLKPQTGVSWELGWNWSGPRSSLAVTAYQLDLDNEILFDSSRFVNINLDSSRRRGLILTADHQLTPAMRIGGTYTLTDSELTAGSFKGNEVPYVARHQFSLFTNYRFDQNWNLYTDLQYTGSRYRAGDDANDQPRLDADLVLNTSLRWHREQWSAQLNVNNLLDKEYYSYAGYSGFSGNYNYPAPTRNLLLTLGYTFR